jgi:hypothetical protein
MSKIPEWARYLDRTPIQNMGAIQEGAYYFVNVVGEPCGVVKIILFDLNSGTIEYEFVSSGVRKTKNCSSIEYRVMKIYDIVD